MLYWKERDGSNLYSGKLNYLFIDPTTIIAKFPNNGKPTDYSDTRIKIIRDYLMVYKEFESFILIITIWDSRQEPLKLEKSFNKRNN